VDFLLVLIELFSLGVTAEALPGIKNDLNPIRRYELILVQNQRFRSNGDRLTQNFRYRRGRSP